MREDLLCAAGGLLYARGSRRLPARRAHPTMASTVSADALALQRLYHWESTTPERVVLTQPLGGGAVRDYTWREIMDEARRMAAHLQSLGCSPATRWHCCRRIRALADERLRDLDRRLRLGAAVPDAARHHPPDLEHSESKLLFVGKLDGWEGIAGIRRPALHQPTRWRPRRREEELSGLGRHRRKSAPLQGQRCATPTSWAPSCTPRAHRRAQGRDAQLRHFRLGRAVGLKRVPAINLTRAC